MRRLFRFFRDLWHLRATNDALRQENERLEQGIRVLRHAILSLATPVVEEGVKPGKPIRFLRPNFSERQMQYEWDHNRRAQDLVEAARALMPRRG